ncbi:MAG: protein translocase subunit SecD [Thermodesulfobacteriota bacterium]
MKLADLKGWNVDKNFKWRVLIVAAALAVSLVYIFPSLAPSLPTWWQKALPSDKISLGLDLKGGMHLVLEVQAAKAVESALERTVEELKFNLSKEKIPVNSLAVKQESGQVELQLAKEEDLEKLNKLLDREFRFLVTKRTTRDSGRLTVILNVDAKEATKIKEMAVRQALETIRNRIDQFGVTEPEIRPQGDDRIVIQLPGIKDTERAIALIGRTALLEFKLVEESRSPEAALSEGLPPGTEVAYETKVNRETGRETKTPHLLRKRALMTGETVTDARVELDSQFNEPYVSLGFDARGARQFERITEANVNKRLAIVLDGSVYSAPVIQEKISGGKARITGSFTLNEARDLAIVLRAGALPAPVKVLEERTVGPSLGQDSINQGLNAVLVGFCLVVIFMAFYYRLSGLIADTALLLNVVIVMACLAAFRATLTLPGIAGIVLTIGIAVDANVLIFERIREEVRLGKTPRAAVDAGFTKAWATIFDSHVSGLVTSLVLFQFGTGPVKGFAVTLTAGLISSLFTAVFVSRVIFDYLLGGLKMKQVSV